MARITGRVEILVNGDLMLNKEGAIARGISEAGAIPVEREEIMGDTGLHGFKETPVVAECEVTLTDRDDVSLSSLAAIKGDGTVIFRAAGGGKVYTMPNAFCVSNFELTAGDGEVTVIFKGPVWVEGIQ